MDRWPDHLVPDKAEHAALDLLFLRVARQIADYDQNTPLAQRQIERCDYLERAIAQKWRSREEARNRYMAPRGAG